MGDRSEPAPLPDPRRAVGLCALVPHRAFRAVQHRTRPRGTDRAAATVPAGEVLPGLPHPGRRRRGPRRRARIHPGRTGPAGRPGSDQAPGDRRRSCLDPQTHRRPDARAACPCVTRLPPRRDLSVRGAHPRTSARRAHPPDPHAVRYGNRRRAEHPGALDPVAPARPGTRQIPDRVRHPPQRPRAAPHPLVLLLEHPGLAGRPRPATRTALPPPPHARRPPGRRRPPTATALLGITRTGILRAAATGATTTEAARHAGVTPTTASHHTTVLRDAGLITSHRHANTMLHALTPLGASLLQQNGRHRVH
ncbi:helix-turn-helix domain-containing protein [Streptomyces sp. NPDC001652]|uniref:helix-turn-helix domain-containing protein n=1 Tax=Streptomyces sp. NPDC001652 TaxID=3154393 RepID=UPI003325765C